MYVCMYVVFWKLLIGMEYFVGNSHKESLKKLDVVKRKEA